MTTATISFHEENSVRPAWQAFGSIRKSWRDLPKSIGFLISETLRNYGGDNESNFLERGIAQR